MSETCKYCGSYFDTSQDENRSHKFRRAITRPVEAYIVGADAGCWHCAALLQFFKQKGNKKDYICESNQQGLGIFSQDVPDNSFDGKHLPDIDMNVYRVTIEGAPNAESKLAPIDIPVSSKSDECFMWIKERLHECENAHDCWNSTDLKTPKRLLEISNDRLILRTNILKEKYATLSHCWGTLSSASIKLLKSTYGNFTHEGIALGDLALTFQDAADVCKRLGIQYIWIDSLCIAQDDPQDWLEESTHMADIYANAFIGLFAGHAKDGNGGLYSNRYDPEPFLVVEKIPVKDGRGQERTMCIQHQRLIGHDLTFYFDLFPDFPSYEYRQLPTVKEPLYQRGWVFQELHLSPRAILFNSTELTWVCNQDAQCECGETTKNIFATKYFFTHVPKTADYPDRLPALSGMAKAFQTMGSAEMKNDVYLAGIWKSMLPEALLWRAVDGPPSGPVRRCRFRKPVAARGPPTWSWMCCDFTVHWQNSYFGSDYLITVDDAQVELGSIDRAGEVAKGHIVLRAVHIEEVVIVYPDDPSFRTNEYTLRDEYIRNSSTEELVSLKDKDCRFSFLPDYDFTDKSLGGLYIPPSETLYCMPVVGLDGYWPFSETSLVLRRHSRSVGFGNTPDVTHVYERVGICDGQIMYSVKNSTASSHPLGGANEAVKMIGGSSEERNSFL
ncbi:heterokaryon incompatibility protein [Fusarium circinatum]|uniref:Heterokaryon incompatibility protein n=1 Tax=Fusarium circinatum TaxID=48490 RepID=A0A8H5WIK8_FUSCI|nr:heterokaryon incompatibility protein [Fusarium circinatum]